MKKMLEYKGYHAQVYYDADDNIFVGEIFGIVDSINFHAKTVDELQNMFHQSIDNYLAMCKHFGKSPDKEYNGVFNIRISPQLHKQLALRAFDENITLNSLVKDILEKGMNNNSQNQTIIWMSTQQTSDFSWYSDTMGDFNRPYTTRKNFASPERIINICQA